MLSASPLTIHAISNQMSDKLQGRNSKVNNTWRDYTLSFFRYLISPNLLILQLKKQATGLPFVIRREIAAKQNGPPVGNGNQ
jgi:hypothetical protein